MDTARTRPGNSQLKSRPRHRLGDQLPLPGDVHWHYRHGRSAASSASLLRAVRDTGLPGPGTAYLAGEARTIQALRSHLMRDRGWPRRAIITKPFWTPGKKGME
jgi:NADPH-dependent ferric siderophore reductase